MGQSRVELAKTEGEGGIDHRGSGSGIARWVAGSEHSEIGLVEVVLIYQVDHLGGQRAYLPYRAGLGVGQFERRGKGIDQLQSIVGSAIKSGPSAEDS